MKSLDDELKDALRREQPSTGFVDRVIARAAEARSRPGDALSRPGLIRPGVNEIPLQPDPTGYRGRCGSLVGSGFSGRSASFVGSGFSRIGARWLAAAAVVLAVGGAGIQYRATQIERARAERAAGEAASQRVMLALQIAGSKLQLVQSRINRLHEQPDRNTVQ